LERIRNKNCILWSSFNNNNFKAFYLEDLPRKSRIEHIIPVQLVSDTAKMGGGDCLTIDNTPRCSLPINEKGLANKE